MIQNDALEMVDIGQNDFWFNANYPKKFHVIKMNRDKLFFRFQIIIIVAISNYQTGN